MATPVWSEAMTGFLEIWPMSAVEIASESYEYFLDDFISHAWDAYLRILPFAFG